MTRKTNGNYLIILAIILGQLITPIDVGLVNVSLPSIGQGLNLGIAASGWIMGAFWLFATAFMMITGRMGDMLGRKKIFSWGIAVFLIGSAASALSPNFPILLTMRALQGLGAALTSANSPALICGAFSDEERGKALGLLAATISLGLAIGPLIGGFICASLGWRYVFFLNLPIGAAALILCLRVIPESEVFPEESMDFYGALMLLAVLTPACVALTQSSQWGLLSPAALGLFILAFAACWVFLRHERATPHPLLDLNLLRIPSFSLSNLAAYTVFIAFRVALFVTPFFLQYYRGLPVQSIGLIISLANVVPLLLLIPSGVLSDRIGTTALELFGMFSIALALGLPVLAGYDLSVPLIVISLLLIGFGYGLFYSPNLRAVMISVPQSKLGFAGGVSASMRNFGFLTSIALASSVMGAWASRRPDTPGVIFTDPGFQAAIRHAYFAAFLVTLLGLAFLYLRHYLMAGVKEERRVTRD